LEKEITNLKDIEAVQGQENREMINLKSGEELEKFNLQQSETHLRAKEIELLQKIESIKNEIIATENQ
jgi:hypothetical protein